MEPKNLQDCAKILWLSPFTFPADVAIIDKRLRERHKICARGLMDKAPDSGSGYWGFESLRAYQSKIIRTLSQQEKGSDCFCSLGLEQ